MLIATTILFTIIFKPLIDGFNLTSRSNTIIESQTAARETDREVTRLLSNAVFVFDNANTPLNLWFTDQGGNPILMTTRFNLWPAPVLMPSPKKSPS